MFFEKLTPNFIRSKGGKEVVSSPKRALLVQLVVLWCKRIGPIDLNYSKHCRRLRMTLVYFSACRQLAELEMKNLVRSWSLAPCSSLRTVYIIYLFQMPSASWTIRSMPEPQLVLVSKSNIDSIHPRRSIGLARLGTNWPRWSLAQQYCHWKGKGSPGLRHSLPRCRCLEHI